MFEGLLVTLSPRVTMRLTGHHLGQVPSHLHPLEQTIRTNKDGQMQSQAVAVMPTAPPPAPPSPQGMRVSASDGLPLHGNT